MQFHDRMGIGGKRKLADGRMVVDARFARAGIYLYSGTEVDPDNANGMRDRAKVKVYRPPSEVFAPDSMASFAHKAVTDDHPPEMVGAGNWQTYAKGWTEGGVAGDGFFVHVPMMLADGGLVAKVEDGTKELSAGYDAEIHFELGFTPAGEAYDAIMRTIRGNHIAVVDRGRAGPDCSIADSEFEGADAMTTPAAVATKSFVYDGISIVVTDQAEQVIVKLQTALADAKAAGETAATAHATAITAKDTELGTKDAEIADLKGKVLDDAALDTLVADRAALLADVAKVADGIDVKGKSVTDIRRAAVLKALGDGGAAKLDGKSDDYVSALFDAMVARAGDGTRQVNDGAADPLAGVLADALPGGGNGNGPVGDSGKAYQAMLDRRRKAWEHPGEESKAA